MPKIERGSNSSVEGLGSPFPSSSSSFKILNPGSERDSIKSSASSESPACWERVANFFKFIFDRLCALFCCRKDDDSEDRRARASQPFVPPRPPQKTSSSPPSTFTVLPKEDPSDLSKRKTPVPSDNLFDDLDVLLSGFDPFPLLSSENSPSSSRTTPRAPSNDPSVSLNSLLDGLGASLPPPSQETPLPAADVGLLDDSLTEKKFVPLDSVDNLLAWLDELGQSFEPKKKAQPERRHRNLSFNKVSQVPLGSVKEKEFDGDYLDVIKLDLRNEVARLTQDSEKIKEIFGHLEMCIEMVLIGEEALKLSIWDTFDYLAQLEGEMALEVMTDPDKYSADVESTRGEAFEKIRETLRGVASRYLTDEGNTIFHRQFTLDQELKKILLRLTTDERRSIWQRILKVSSQNSLQEFCCILKGILQRAHVKTEAEAEDSASLEESFNSGTIAIVEGLLRAWAGDLKVEMPEDFGMNWMLGKEDREIKGHYIDRIEGDIRNLWGALLEDTDQEALGIKLSEITESMQRATDAKSVSVAAGSISHFMTVEIAERVFQKKGGELDPNYFTACAEQYLAVLSSLTAWIFYSLPIAAATEAFYSVEKKAETTH